MIAGAIRQSITTNRKTETAMKETEGERDGGQSGETHSMTRKEPFQKNRDERDLLNR